MLNSESVRELIALGRKAVEAFLEGKELKVRNYIKSEYSFKRGIFTTLLIYPQKELRGCVGIPYPSYPLWEAVIRTSISSAFEDPRFKPLIRSELSNVIWEISLLGSLEEVKENPEDSIKVGKHGVLVEYGQRKGLLLPQVAVEYTLTSEEFLNRACLKAGLEENLWKREKVKIFRFEADIYREVEPCGEVVKVELI